LCPTAAKGAKEGKRRSTQAEKSSPSLPIPPVALSRPANNLPSPLFPISPFDIAPPLTPSAADHNGKMLFYRGINTLNSSKNIGHYFFQ
jgi:hypothetical protein